MRVALAPSFEPVKRPGTAVEGRPLLDAAGPEVVLGWDADTIAAPIAPTAGSLFGPRGVCLHPDGSLWVADTGHHRLLGWRTIPRDDNQPADIVIGQPGFSAEGRNAKGPVSPATLNVPTGLTTWGRGLAVADAWNHRVLIWRETPTRSEQPADLILGQRTGDGSLANQGSDQPTAGSLNWPYGVAEIAGQLAVCDTGNRRLLVWDDVDRSGQPADRVLGQTGFDCRDENGGADVGPGGMRWPHSALQWGDRLCVADAGNNRIMVWSGFPDRDGAPAGNVLGQSDMSACDHNQAAYYPSAAALNMPYATAVIGDHLVVADTANSRLLGWIDDRTGSPADRLTGQPDFAAKGDNRWGIPERDSLCWQYGLSALGTTLAIADSGNNRVLLWQAAP